MTSRSLLHWGIPGMKWGIRRRQSNTAVTGKTHSSDHTTAVSLKKKRLSEMSNDELKKLTTRMQLEKQYKDLSKTDISSGQKAVQEIFGNAGKQLASKFVASMAESFIKNTGNLAKDLIVNNKSAQQGFDKIFETLMGLNK